MIWPIKDWQHLQLAIVFDPVTWLLSDSSRSYKMHGFYELKQIQIMNTRRQTSEHWSMCCARMLEGRPWERKYMGSTMNRTQQNKIIKITREISEWCVCVRVFLCGPMWGQTLREKKCLGYTMKRKRQNEKSSEGKLGGCGGWGGDGRKTLHVVIQWLTILQILACSSFTERNSKPVPQFFTPKYNLVKKCHIKR